MLLELLIFLITLIIIYYWYANKRAESIFARNNVKYIPGWPMFGNCLNSKLLNKHTFHDINRIYKAFPNERYVGMMNKSKPIVIIRDPVLIKQMTVKDFDHFTDHQQLMSEHIEPLFNSSLFMMKGEKWRNMRATLSPAFTGSKIKHMMQFMVDISNNTLEYLKEHKNEDIDVDDLMRRYTNDVIASASFGFEINSFKDRDNEFFKIGQTVHKFSTRQMFLLVLDYLIPSIMKKSGVKLYPKKTYLFFENLVLKTVEYRKAHNVLRPDMIQLLMETPKEWTLLEFCAQTFIFIAGGLETTASSLILSVHELAVNPDVQEKLYQEIRAFKEANGDITYDKLKNLKYLDCIFNETLRKWSPTIIIDRKCVKTYELPPASEGGKPFILHPGDAIYNSASCLHLDPKYWPDPYKFDPDRWSEENKHKIKPFTYQPFGIGQRQCIGSRFAVLETKVLLYYLVLNFKILKCQKTSDPIELINYGFNIKTMEGTWVKFEERT